MAGGAPRILILSASIGEGHDLPARALAEGIRAEEPAAEVEIADVLALAGPGARRLAMGGSQFYSEFGARLFDLEFWLINRVRATRAIAGGGMALTQSRRIGRAIAERDPDAIVCTYPGASELLGRMKRGGRLEIPLASAITDLAALRWWAHPGVDLHLIIHPESAEEVRSIAPESEIRAVRGLTAAAFYESLDQAEGRRALELPGEGPLVLVSGGGWGVGDLAGAAEAAVAAGATAVCLCGRNDEVRESLASRFEGSDRVIVLGFTERMSELMAAADVLVHSTAGLTVLEAIMRGCGVISYGWGHGHIRANNAAYERFGLARVAADREELDRAMAHALAEPHEPDRSFESLPSAASLVLGLVG